MKTDHTSIDHEEIEKRLKQLPQESVVLFAYRCAIRALPFVSIDREFSCWHEDKRQQHLMALIRCLDFHNAARSASDAVAASNAAADDYNQQKQEATMAQAVLADLELLESGQQALAAIGSSPFDDRFIECLEAIDMHYWADVYSQYLTGAINQAAAQRRRELPEGILASGYQAVTAYLQAAEQGEEHSFHEVKAVFLGDGGAGKTSLVTRIIDRAAPLPKQEDRTAGVEVQEHTIPDSSDHKIRIWDFGGQLVYHAAHQLFMTERTLYVVVLDNRRENKPDYWLKHAEVFGGDSPVFVVINTWDQHQDGIAETTLEKAFPRIVGFYHIACSEPDSFDFDRFLQDFYRTCKEHTSWERSLPKQWFEVKEGTGATEPAPYQLPSLPRGMPRAWY